jgi:MSHA biogenesis protein MshM
VDGERVFRERVALSRRWLAGIHQGSFTIQLMTLTSNQAQATMTQMLARNDYYQLRDQLYLFRKKTNPPTLFVFYGQYDSFEAARQARNDMPSFLRKQQPYPLAISEALKKL